jgi:prepilin-type N-terminal cleavage/methylation domain-containing protein
MKRRGFTFVEMSVVIMVIAIFSALAVPNIASTIDGGRHRAFRHSVLTMIREARVEAVSSKQTVAMSYTDDGFQLTVNDENDQESVIKSVAKVDGVDASHFTTEGQETADSSWRCAFYPDGTNDGGSFEFDEGSDSQTVTINKRDGRITLNDGQYDEATNPDQEWDAGGYVQTGG